MKKTIIKFIFWIALILMVATAWVGLFKPTTETNLKIGAKEFSYKLPAFVKFAACLEREYVYQFFVNDVIASEVTDKEKETIRIFNWINEHLVDTPPSILTPIERHELDFIIRQYGNHLDRIRAFRNLLEFVGSSSRSANTSLEYNKQMTGRGVVIAGVEGRDLYFDMENKLFLVRPDGRVASTTDIKNQPQSLSLPTGVKVEINHQIFDESARRLSVKDMDSPERPSMQRCWGRLKNRLLTIFQYK
jgi:hypothetical protein